MAQKYPSDKPSYRNNRQVSDCCYSHRNWLKPKIRYATLAEAEKAAGTTMVVVKCQNAAGFHLKTDRRHLKELL